MNPSPTDTICAISTPHGTGGIAVIRISGPRAIAAADAIWRGTPLAQAPTHTARLGRIVDPATGETLDSAVATLFRAPGSFTGEDTVELSVHGSTWIQTELLRLLCTIEGVRLAQAGEFTRRAFASGRIDLTQAEAVADVIAARSRAEARMAIGQLRGNFSRRIDELRRQLIDLSALLELELDFSEEEVEFASRTDLSRLASTIHTELSSLARSYSAGSSIKNGIPVAIVGPTNVGKSSLLNALTGDDRAIVSDIHGTTRDIVEDTIPLGDYRLRLMDTAGLRNATSDPIEAIGIDRSLSAARSASVLLIVADATRPVSIPELMAPLGPDFTPPQATILVINKADLAPLPTSISLSPLPEGTPVIATSATTLQGIDTLRQAILSAITTEIAPADARLIVTNLRQAQALQAAAQAAADVSRALTDGIPPDLVAQHLRQVLHHLADLTGAITTPTLLATIFSRFCIGK